MEDCDFSGDDAGFYSFYGMTTLRQDGWRKVLNGTTTVDEVTRNTAGDIS